MTLMIIIFLSILIFSLCFSHHDLFYNVWQESYIYLFSALLCLALLQLGVPRIDNNIQIPIFNGVAQKVILASDHCEISTTLNKKQ